MPTPLQDERVDTQLGKIQLYRGGSGAPLVYLHSALGETGPGQPMLEQLADDFDVLAPLFPGFGESEGVEEIDDIEDAVFHLLDLFDRLGLEALALTGLSLGGWMAAEVATRYPERASKLVLLNPVGLYIEGHPIEDLFGKRPNELAEMVFSDLSHPVAQIMLTLGARFDDPTEVANIPFEMVAPTLRSMNATARLGWDPYMHNPKLRRRLHRVSAPTLVVHGVDDGFLPRAHCEAYAEGIEGARLVDVEGAAHMLTLDKPADAAELVKDFLG